MRIPLAIRRWRSRRTLDGLTGTERVFLFARVLTANWLVSPMTDMRGVMMHWTVREHFTSYDQAGPSETSQLLTSGTLGRDLRVEAEGRTILLPYPGFHLRASALDTGAPAPRPFPDAWCVPPTSAGEPFYAESLLRQGDLVRVTAVVTATHSASRGAFRGNDDAVDFVAVYNHEAALVEDWSVQSLVG